MQKRFGWIVFCSLITLLGCTSQQGEKEHDPSARERYCRNLARDINLDTTREPGIQNLSVPEHTKLTQAYKNARCEDFE